MRLQRGLNPRRTQALADTTQPAALTWPRDAAFERALRQTSRIATARQISRKTAHQNDSSSASGGKGIIRQQRRLTHTRRDNKTRAAAATLPIEQRDLPCWSETVSRRTSSRHGLVRSNLQRTRANGATRCCTGRVRTRLPSASKPRCSRRACDRRA